jgi:hypothetical protein
MTLSTSLVGFAGKVTTLTIVLLFSCITLTNQSCGMKLPSEVTGIVGNLSSQLPKFMSQATDLFGPKYADQAKGILDMISQGANLTKGGKTQEVSDMFGKLGKDNVEPFLESWKSKGKLSSSEIASATKGTNEALGAIKKVGKIK